MNSRRPARKKLYAALCLSALLAVAAAPAWAVDVSGTASIFATSSDNRGLGSDLLEQQYTFSLFQRFTPYVSMRFGYQHFDQATDFDDGESLGRRSREPSLELLYNRQRLTARLALRDRTADGTLDANNFESSSFLASLSWQPARGPGFLLSYRDETNRVDQAVFGRDVDSQFVFFETFYRRPHWGASYSFQRSQLDRQTSQLASEQDRHEVRAYASRRFAKDRLALSFSSSVSRVDRTTRFGEGAELADPVPAAGGLFAVDTAPEIGELEPAPDLVDGNVEVPAAPGIDIGGANTFRNVGVNLGVVAPVSLLEVSVDTLSGPVLWRVYHSPDNLTWTQVSSTVSEFDSALLRYSIRFAETTDRYFKAVNVSINSEPRVLVTEVRAFLRFSPSAAEESFESDLFRADLNADFQPSERISMGVNVGGSNDEDFSAGLVRRDFSEVHAGARVGVDLLRELTLNLSFRYSDSENLRDQPLLRTVSSYSASLVWTPLPTVDAVLTVLRRDEEDESVLLQSNRSTRLLVTTELLPDLRLISDFEVFDLEAPRAGISRRGRAWRERLEAQPTRRWTVGGGYSYSRFESSAGERLFERTEIDLRTTWIASAYLSLTGGWSVGREAGLETFRQSYSLAYNPGPKLSISAVYQEFETLTTRVTANDAISASYRFNNHLSLFANLSRSRLGQAEGEADEITSLRTGLRLFY